MAGFGSLANLAKILEDASKPDSSVREDRERRKAVLKKGTVKSLNRAVDPKRKAWHERRLKALAVNQDKKEAAEDAAAAPSPAQLASRAATKSVASAISGSLMQTLAAAKDGAKPAKEGTKRAEAWKRKPGDPVF